MSNTFVVEGKVHSRAESILYKKNNQDCVLVKFTICDRDPAGPGSLTAQPMYLEVHITNEYLINFSDRLVENKHILVSGSMCSKKLQNINGMTQKTIYYLRADWIKFLD